MSAHEDGRGPGSTAEDVRWLREQLGNLQSTVIRQGNQIAVLTRRNDDLERWQQKAVKALNRLKAQEDDKR